MVITQVSDDVTYVDALANAEGALILWEVPHDDRSDVFVVATAGGKVTSAVATAAHDVYGWQVVGTERGAAVATVPIESGDGGARAASRGRRRPRRSTPSPADPSSGASSSPRSTPRARPRRRWS